MATAKNPKSNKSTGNTLGLVRVARMVMTCSARAARSGMESASTMVACLDGSPITSAKLDGSQENRALELTQKGGATFRATKVVDVDEYTIVVGDARKGRAVITFVPANDRFSIHHAYLNTLGI